MDKNRIRGGNSRSLSSILREKLGMTLTGCPFPLLVGGINNRMAEEMHSARSTVKRATGLRL